MTFEDYVEAANIARKYATAVESHLYMNMKTSEAHSEINKAISLAEKLESAAARCDTTYPTENE